MSFCTISSDQQTFQSRRRSSGSQKRKVKQNRISLRFLTRISSDQGPFLSVIKWSRQNFMNQKSWSRSQVVLCIQALWKWLASYCLTNLLCLLACVRFPSHTSNVYAAINHFMWVQRSDKLSRTKSWLVSRTKCWLSVHQTFHNRHLSSLIDKCPVMKGLAMRDYLLSAKLNAH